MALDVEDGSGKPTAEAYESVANADVYIAAHGLEWPDNYSIPQKEIALRLGSQHLDKEYRTRLQGFRVTKEQALDWPRINVTIAQGRFAIDSNEIPEDVKRANIHAALDHSASGSVGLNPNKSDPGTVKIDRVKIDVLEFETEWTSGKDDEKEYTMVDRLMAQYLGQGDRVIRA